MTGSRGGRPQVGGRVTTHLGELLEQVDAWARSQHVTRAEAIRRLIERGLRCDHEPLVEALREELAESARVVIELRTALAETRTERTH